MKHLLALALALSACEEGDVTDARSAQCGRICAPLRAAVRHTSSATWHKAARYECHCYKAVPLAEPMPEVAP